MNKYVNLLQGYMIKIILTVPLGAQYKYDETFVMSVLIRTQTDSHLTLLVQLDALGLQYKCNCCLECIST